MKILIEPAMIGARDGWKATLTASTGKVFAWHVINFADIESQALAYEESEAS